MSFIANLFRPKPKALVCPHCEREMEEGHDVDRCASKRMSRRFFFGLMAGAGALVVLPESMTAINAAPSVFIEPVCGGNRFLTVDVITSEMLYVLQKNMTLGRARARKVSIRRPLRFTGI